MKLNLSTGKVNKTSFKQGKLSLVKKSKLVATTWPESVKNMKAEEQWKYYEEKRRDTAHTGDVLVNGFPSINTCSPTETPNAYECGGGWGGYNHIEEGSTVVSRIKGDPLTKNDYADALSIAKAKAEELRQKNSKLNTTELLYGTGNSPGLYKREIDRKYEQAYDKALSNGFSGTMPQWLSKFSGPVGRRAHVEYPVPAEWKVYVVDEKVNDPNDWYVDPTWGLKRKK
ncbi:MAG: hypothetical protein A4E53_01732 [Pelotomaculum sp. PtaB.Bin104]|nr:MAG: hypothetical protein A4E53_01732 [Pelotomaculum sp. PtaB.Bin104]